MRLCFQTLVGQAILEKENSSVPNWQSNAVLYYYLLIQKSDLPNTNRICVLLEWHINLRGLFNANAISKEEKLCYHLI